MLSAEDAFAAIDRYERMCLEAKALEGRDIHLTIPAPRPVGEVTQLCRVERVENGFMLVSRPGATTRSKSLWRESFLIADIVSGRVGCPELSCVY